MRAMLWKELRENIKWAVLAMAGLALAELYGIFYYDPLNYNNRGITLCSPTFLMATSFGNALVGLLLGLVQILPEQRRDQWAALLHRPVSRAVIFRGKAAAGLLLYLIATVPPFLLCFWLAATPGHFVAPFVPDLVLPGVSDICVGAAYYFAALTVALQRGSWFGARTFALLAAVYLSCSMSTMQYFYVAVEAAVILAILLLAAAWGAMLSNGKFRDRPWLGKLGLLAAVFYGVCGVGVLATILLNVGRNLNYDIGGEYKITQDGQLIIVTTHPDLTTTITDLAGNPIHDARYTGATAYENEINIFALSLYTGNSHGYESRSDYFNYRLSYEYIQEIQSYGLAQPIQWFYLQGPRYTVGIDRRSKAPVEVVDPSGFHPAGTPVVPFIGDLSHWYDNPCLIQDGNDVFTCDLGSEKFAKLSGSDSSPISGLQLLIYQASGGKGYDRIIVVSREDGIQLYDSKNVPIGAFPYNPGINLDRWGYIQFGNNSSADRFYIRYSPSLWLSWAERNQMPSYLDELDAKGNILHSYTLPPLPPVPGHRTWDTYLGESLKSPAFWFWDLAYEKIGASMGNEHLGKRARNSFDTGWPHTKDISERVLMFSLVFSLVALAVAKYAGMSWPRSAAWAVFAFAFNLAGLITFRLVADWPVRVRCPQCGRQRRVEDATCPACHAGWPVPARGGIEVFDDEPTLQPLASRTP